MTTKIAVITDTHWGVRNDSVAFLDMTKRFLDEVFFPYLDKHKIKTVIHLGDLVDRRKQISFLTAKRLREDFLQPLAARKIEYHQLLGNHDVFYKNTNEVNAVQELWSAWDTKRMHSYATAANVTVQNQPMTFVPWICADNREETLRVLGETSAPICMGHLELQGFEMHRGSVAAHGDDRKLFSKFDLTLSGHYHHRSTDGSIYYLGSHGEFTWADFDDARGFHVLDTKTRELEFIQNPHKMFSKIWYDDANTTLEKLVTGTSFIDHKNTYVKVIVTNKLNPFWFEKFCQRLEKVGVISMQIVDDHLNLNLENDEQITGEAESTLDLFIKNIDNVQGNVDRYQLERVIRELYEEAQHLELA